MKKVIRLTESDLVRIVQRVINENNPITVDKNKAMYMLGYISEFEDKMMDNLPSGMDQMTFLASKKELMIFLEQTRDGYTPKPLSKNGQILFNVIQNMVNPISSNQEAIKKLIEKGRNIKHQPI